MRQYNFCAFCALSTGARTTNPHGILPNFWLCPATCAISSRVSVISDYVPKSSRGAARGAMLAASVIAALGLLKVWVVSRFSCPLEYSQVCVIHLLRESSPTSYLWPRSWRDTRLPWRDSRIENFVGPLGRFAKTLARVDSFR